MMAEKKARQGASQAEAVEKIREGETFVVNLPLLGQTEIPRPEQLATTAGWPLWPPSNSSTGQLRWSSLPDTCWQAITTTGSSRSLAMRWKRSSRRYRPDSPEMRSWTVSNKWSNWAWTAADGGARPLSSRISCLARVRNLTLVSCDRH